MQAWVRRQVAHEIVGAFELLGDAHRTISPSASPRTSPPTYPTELLAGAAEAPSRALVAAEFELRTGEVPAKKGESVLTAARGTLLGRPHGRLRRQRHRLALRPPGHAGGGARARPQGDARRPQAATRDAGAMEMRRAVQRYVAHVAPVADKELRDALRLTERRLRDTFQGLAQELAASADAALASVGRTAELDDDGRAARGWSPSTASSARWRRSGNGPRRWPPDVRDAARRRPLAPPSRRRRPCRPTSAPRSRKRSAGVGEPLRVAIAGRVKAGKSTLLNALVGEELAPTDASECTRIVTWYRHGLHLRGARPSPVAATTTGVPFERVDRAVNVELGELDAADVEQPRGALAFGSPRGDDAHRHAGHRVAQRRRGARGRRRSSTPRTTRRRRPTRSLYLMQHTHPGDVRLLESFQDDELGRGSPINAVGVLSRADEIGGCRLDALTTCRPRRRAIPRHARSCAGCA